MNKKNRKLALAKLEKQAMLNKVAEDAVADINLADIQDSKEYAHKLFEKLLSEIHIDVLDD